MIASYQEVDILRKIGIRVPQSQVSETMALLLTDPDFAKEIDRIKASMVTMINEDQFIDVISVLLSALLLPIKISHKFPIIRRSYRIETIHFQYEQ